MAQDNARYEQGRITRLSAALVIARRDFTAILFKRSFIFFLLSPFFPLVVGALAGGIGNEVRQASSRPELGIAMRAADVDAMLAAEKQLGDRIGGSAPALSVLQRLKPGEVLDPQQALAQGKGNLAAVLSGTPAEPVLTGPVERISQWQGPVSLIAARAMGRGDPAYPDVALTRTVTSHADQKQGQTLTAQTAQTVMFLLMMVLAGMVLSNLVEEKGNKIIEILAAAVPMDAVFLGKLFAMLAVSMVGSVVWAGAGAVLVTVAGNAMPHLPAPAVGWPLFLALGVVYFGMGYLLIGSVFLAVGSMAPTVREVQTLSMPASMAQLLLFLFATYALARPGSAVEFAAMAIPFSSPFAMIARAAQSPALWPHVAALAWQGLWVIGLVRMGAALFRTWVMKSGAGGAPKKRKGWIPRRAAA